MSAPKELATSPAWVRLGLPVVVGVLCGVGFMLGPTGPELPATIVGIAALCYLAAAATGRRWMAWAWVAIGSVLRTAAEFTDVSWSVMLAAVAVVLLAYGIVRRRPATWVEAAGMLGYFGLAMTTLLLSAQIGLAAAGLVLAAHAVWDIVHYRWDVVVHRSLALWCIGLDVTAGTACVVLALVS